MQPVLPQPPFDPGQYSRPVNTQLANDSLQCIKNKEVVMREEDLLHNIMVVVLMATQVVVLLIKAQLEIVGMEVHLEEALLLVTSLVVVAKLVMVFTC